MPPIRVLEKPSTFHPLAQRNAFAALLCSMKKSRTREAWILLVIGWALVLAATYHGGARLLSQWLFWAAYSSTAGRICVGDSGNVLLKLDLQRRERQREESAAPVISNDRGSRLGAPTARLKAFSRVLPSARAEGGLVQLSSFSR
jgi:hypothetical protein